MGVNWVNIFFAFGQKIDVVFNSSSYQIVSNGKDNTVKRQDAFWHFLNLDVLHYSSNIVLIL